MGLTSMLRRYFRLRAERTDSWGEKTEALQRRQLLWLLHRGRHTEYGRIYDFRGIAESAKLYETYSESVPQIEYEDIRSHVEKMMRGGRDVLWPGMCRDYAQSSGTSGGKSKYIPITSDSLQRNHYSGGTDAVAHYLRLCPESRLFQGKALILGGSFANEIEHLSPKTKVGDLSATLINRINPLANLLRVPDKKTALMADWSRKLPMMAAQALKADITNISGVPSWMLTLLREVMSLGQSDNLKTIWPNLEVFFHGGISFVPYREEYASLMQGDNIRYLENYNASEGFFAVQNDFDDTSLLLLLDSGIFFEFLPLAGGKAIPAWDVKKDETYELLITSCNGLWRYSPGDTVTVTSVKPLKIKIAGRTKSFINAFGEEVMEWNAEKAITAACLKTAATIRNYTVAPLFSHNGTKACHQWLIEWTRKPDSIEDFTLNLDKALQLVNSDYQAKRSGDIFLGLPEIISLPAGTFDAWLSDRGNGKLGGQRKIPRLSNDRLIADAVLQAAMRRG